MGTTSDKLTYLSGTKDKLKTAINYTGANITNDTFRSYPEKLYNEYVNIINNGTDTLYANMPKVTGTGTNLTLNNTKKAPLLLSLYGDTQQDSTPTPSSPQPIHNVSGDNTIEICGKNIANFTKVNSLNITNGSVDLTQSYSSGFTATFYIDEKTLLAGNYTLCFKDSVSGSSNSDQSLYYNSSTSNYLGDFHLKTKKFNYCNFTVTETINVSNFRIWIPTGYVGTLSEIMLVKETITEPPTYEAYTGQSQLISLGVENLFDISTITTGKTINEGTGNVTTDASGRDTSDFIKVKPNTQYTCSTTMTRYAYYDENKTFKNFYTGGTTITTNSDTQYIR